MHQKENSIKKAIVINDGKIPNDMLDKYIREEEKSPVIIDKNELNKMNVKVRIAAMFSTVNSSILKIFLQIFLFEPKILKIV